MNYLVEVDGTACTLDFRRNGTQAEYTLHGVEAASGVASVLQAAPGVYSVLLGDRSFAVNVARTGAELEVWVAGQRHMIRMTDLRDRIAKVAGPNAAGPLEVRAQMPGKIIKVLVDTAEQVDAGQGLIVIEAMKMQNEIKSPKSGVIARICVLEGATVAAGEVLMVVG